MNRTMLASIAPAYLILCIVLGGSAQGVWTNAALQILAIAILVLTAARQSRHSPQPAARYIQLLTGCGILVVGLQLIPLPPAVWTALPGRDFIAEGYRLLGYPLPRLPLSETPSDTIATVLTLLPAIGMFAAVQVSHSRKGVTAALLAGTAAAIIVGALQVAGGRDAWKFYPISNSGAVGFFANSNHMATLLLVSIPFAAALLVSAKARGREAHGRGAALTAVGIAALILILIGIALNGSLAALLLAGPVILGSALILPFGWRWRGLTAPIAGLALIAAVVGLGINPVQSNTPSEGAATAIESRETIWNTTIEAIEATFPAGTGLGSFDSVYPGFENPDVVTATYVNHAHNDYLELTLELGVAGVVLILLFLAWWCIQSLRIWRSNVSGPFARAATIASAAILAHSVVDYPLRTAAISAIFAMCVALIASHGRRQRSSEGDESGKARHVTIG